MDKLEKLTTLEQVNYFIDKFTLIPKEEWCVGKVTKNENDIIQYCAIGHARNGSLLETEILQSLFMRYLMSCVSSINDGRVYNITVQGLKGRFGLSKYISPKDRILFALNKIKEAITK